jgi:hypothetical protein
MHSMKFIKKLLLLLITLIVVSLAGVCLWMMIPYPAQQEAIQNALRPDDHVAVSQDDYLVFTPQNAAVENGLIFYPGGKTEVTTFAPLLRQIAATGVLVVAVPMPLNTAFLDVDSANQVMQDFPAVQQWFLAGHSLGGVAAAMYASTQAQHLQGLVLWASYPAADISSQALNVLSVFARNDRSTTLQDIGDHKAWLPANTVYTEIQGNHWQFGHYSDGQNQQPQTISREQQQADILAATLEFIGS